MNFGQALEQLNAGERLCRAGWHNKFMFIVKMDGLKLPPFNTQGTNRKVNDRTAKWIGEDSPLDCQPYVALYIEQTNVWQPGWVPSQADMFADDWEVIPEGE